MYTVIITLILISAVLLVLVVLAQNPKGGGLSSQFGGSGASQLMGVKKTGDFLEKTTWTLAITVMVLTVVSTIYAPDAGKGKESPNTRKAKEMEQPALDTGEGDELDLGDELNEEGED
jgi:preprotein translocase subunit SecG